MFEFECEGKNGINKLSLTTDDFEKFSKVMGLVDKFSRDEEEVKPIFCIMGYLNGRYAIHCNTENKLNILFKYLKDMDFKQTYRTEYYFCPRWNYYKTETCYDFNNGFYGNPEELSKGGYTILEFDDYDWSDWE